MDGINPPTIPIKMDKAIPISTTYISKENRKANSEKLWKLLVENSTPENRLAINKPKTPARKDSTNASNKNANKIWYLKKPNASKI